MIADVVGEEPSKISTRSFIGKYYHALILHSPTMLRIVNGRTANAEDEERIFQSFKSTTKNTSNQHGDHILFNFLIRNQVKQEIQKHSYQKKQNEVNKLAHSLNYNSKTTIPFWIIDKYPWEWESHLKRISDFILESGWWDECDAGISFNDNKLRHDTSLRVHHFRSSNMKKELNHLDLCWKMCLKNPDLIPAQKVKSPEGSSFQVLHLNNIKSLDIEIVQAEELDTPSSYSTNYFGGEKNIFPPFKKSKCESICHSQDLENDNDDNDVDFDVDFDDNDEDDIATIKKIDIIEAQKSEINNVFKTKTGSYLYSVLPEHETLVKSYDQNKWKLRNYGPSFKHAYEIDLARLEVLLLNKLDELLERLHEIEMKNIESDGSLKIIEIDEEEYNSILDKTTTISALRSSMNI